MFKFHCNESFTNFKKIVRIHDAVNLINKGYLKNSTIESLATTVGFVAYSTFSVAFKDITGSTAHDYGV
jgi:transcriptional regulator GlxA family with amidase domain